MSPPLEILLYKEGEIHLCSVDFSSQFLATFSAHVTPVNCVAWNPFYHNLFLSCASEYRVLLWHRWLLNTRVCIRDCSSITSHIFKTF